MSIPVSHTGATPGELRREVAGAAAEIQDLGTGHLTAEGELSAYSGRVGHAFRSNPAG